MTCSSSCGRLLVGGLAGCLSSAARFVLLQSHHSSAPYQYVKVDHRSDCQWPIGADLDRRPSERGMELCMIGSTPFFESMLAKTPRLYV
ncbi:hypothetical protein CGRA01v4_06920 [Colletotrichum graminicola]|nr:hypothetical protein CGRA01v4_06920 [Colletotrichum graminicola]